MLIPSGWLVWRSKIDSLWYAGPNRGKHTLTVIEGCHKRETAYTRAAQAYALIARAA